jgi:hypothetical protein
VEDIILFEIKLDMYLLIVMDGILGKIIRIKISVVAVSGGGIAEVTR